MLGFSYYYAARYDEAIDESTRVLEDQPDYAPALWSLVLTYIATERYDEAMDANERLLAAPGWGWASEEDLEDLRQARAAGGWASMIACRTGQVEAMAQQRYVTPVLVAFCHACAGNRGEMLDWLEKADAERDPVLTWAYWWAVFDSYRDDPRFQELVRRMNYPEGTP
jgi:hypothetical protein